MCFAARSSPVMSPCVEVIEEHCAMGAEISYIMVLLHAGGDDFFSIDCGGVVLVDNISHLRCLFTCQNLANGEAFQILYHIHRLI